MKHYRVTYRLRVDGTDVFIYVLIDDGRIWQAQTRSWDRMVQMAEDLLGEFNAEWIKRITVQERG